MMEEFGGNLEALALNKWQVLAMERGMTEFGYKRANDLMEEAYN